MGSTDVCLESGVGRQKAKCRMEPVALLAVLWLLGTGLIAQPALAGSDCEDDADCGSGQHCFDDYGICVGDCSPSVGLSMSVNVSGCQPQGAKVLFTATMGPFGPYACPVMGGRFVIELPNGSTCEHPGSQDMVLQPGEVAVLHCPYVVRAGDADGNGVLVAVGRWEDGLVGTFPPLPMVRETAYPIKLGIHAAVDPPRASLPPDQPAVEFCAMAHGGSGAFQYTWDSGETTTCIFTDAPGQHCVTASDLSTGCADSACSQLISLQQ